jgi:hypothetical protein
MAFFRDDVAPPLVGGKILASCIDGTHKGCRYKTWRRYEIRRGGILGEHDSVYKNAYVKFVATGLVPVIDARYQSVYQGFATHKGWRYITPEERWPSHR